jgi:ribonucleoside-diphosphate reductase alpha chain
MVDFPSEVQKRDGQRVPYDSSKITGAITKACASVGIYDPELPARLGAKVEELLRQGQRDVIPEVEDVQNLVETTLIRSGYQEVGRSYMLYRQKRQEVRELKQFLGVTDELKLPVNAIQVLKKRYLLKDDDGKLAESTAGFFKRVAQSVASAEGDAFGSPEKALLLEDEFFALMTSGDFLPNSPTLMNAGTELGQLSACFVIPVGDSLPDIFEAVKDMALIQQSGGGTGFSFNHLRSRGDMVQSTHGVASGPVSFMRIFDTTTNVIKQGGRRRGANMGILRVDHPDIMSFITAKEKEGSFTNFNLSVAATSRFMEAVTADERYPLVSPRDGSEQGSLRAKDVFDLIVASAWKTGDPGIVFIDEVNAYNPTPVVGPIESTNPCGEQPLLPYESCNLGSINISNFIREGEVDYSRLAQVVHLAVRFLDNVIEINHYPLPQIRKTTLANRKIGLGVMGFAEFLIGLGIPYDSEEALARAGEVMEFLSREGHLASRQLAAERGSFPNFAGSLWDEKGVESMRNATVTTVAPTGTISILAGTSSGIEPLFAISFMRDVLEGTKLLEVNPLFEEAAVKARCYSKDLALEIAKKGTVQHLEHLPVELRKVFVTSMDIAPEWHVRMQAAFQKHTDNAVSKTVNLPGHATPEDVRRIFLLAWELKCKGITVYRYGSKSAQVLYVGDSKSGENGMFSVSADYSGECPAGACEF